MASEVIVKKLEQLQQLVAQLGEMVHISFDEFRKNIVIIRAAERNFQLMVDIAAEVNTELLIERGKKIPDTYRESFNALADAGVLDTILVEKLVQSAKVRNILVHEYDFEEDYQKFYTAAQESIVVFQEYIQKMYHAVRE